MRELTSYKATTVNETGNDTGNTKIDKLEKSNTGIAINVLLNSKKGIYTALGSEFNRTGGKQVNLSMIMDGEKDSTQQ